MWWLGQKWSSQDVRQHPYEMLVLLTMALPATPQCWPWVHIFKDPLCFGDIIFGCQGFMSKLFWCDDRWPEATHETTATRQVLQQSNGHMGFVYHTLNWMGTRGTFRSSSGSFLFPIPQSAPASCIVTHPSHPICTHRSHVCSVQRQPFSSHELPFHSPVASLHPSHVPQQSTSNPARTDN